MERERERERDGERERERQRMNFILVNCCRTLFVEDLMENLKQVLTEPKKRQLYLAIR